MTDSTDHGAGSAARIDALVADAKQLHQAGRLIEAERLYGQALELDPRHGDALHYRGILLHQKRRDEEAAELLGRAAEEQPDNAVVLGNLGVVLRALARLEEARDAFARAAEAAPDSPEAHFNLAGALHAIGQNDTAEEAYRRAIALDPDHVDALTNLGALLTFVDRPAEAVHHLAPLAERFPDSLPVLRNLAGALLGARRYGDAEVVCRRTLEIDPSFARAHLQLGEILGQLGRIAEGIAAYRQGVALDPSLAYDPVAASGRSGESAPRYVDVVGLFHAIGGAWSLPGYDPERLHLLPINPLIEAAADRPVVSIPFDEVGIRRRFVNISRLAEADTSYPCMVLVDAPNPSGRKYRLIDGNHRIHRLIHEGQRVGRFYVFELDEVRELIRPREYFFPGEGRIELDAELAHPPG